MSVLRSFLSRMRAFFSFPVLVRELSEQANRKRTYAMRVLYSLIVFSLGSLGIIDLLIDGEIPFASLGQGAQVFDVVVTSQFVFVYVFLPAYCSGLITSEKERNTFGLLLLSKLSPSGIIVEKMLSRLIPFAWLLVMAAPILGLAYGVGGVEQAQVWSAVYLLVLAAVQVAAIAIACSAWFGRSTQAFVATYIVAAGFLYVGPLVAVRLGAGMWSSHFPIAVYGQEATYSSVSEALRQTWQVMVTSAAWLLFARLVVVRRASVQSGAWLERLLKFIDRRVNQISGGRVSTSGELPGDKAVAWMETKRGVLGNTRHQVYLVILLELLTLGWIGFLYLTSTRANFALSVFHGMLLLLTGSALIIVSRSVGVFAGDRSRQTLDVLLTTPLQNREILFQKFLGIRNLSALLLIPLLTFTVFFAIGAEREQEPDGKGMELVGHVRNWFSHYYREGGFRPIRFCVVQLSMLVIYPRMLAWLGVIVGMRCRRVSIALVVVLAIVAAWVVVPLLILVPVLDSVLVDVQYFDFGWGGRSQMFLVEESSATHLFALSPIVAPVTAMFGDALGQDHWTQTVISIVWHLFIWFALRWFAIRQFNRRMARRDERSRGVVRV